MYCTSTYLIVNILTKLYFLLGWQDEVDNILKEQGKFVKTEDAPDSLSLYEETTSCTNNPLKPFDSQPQVSDDYHLSRLSVKIKNIVSLHGNIGC